MKIAINLRAWFGLLSLTVGALLGFSLVLQFQLGLDPCPLCVVQRVAFLALGAVFMLATLHGPKAWGVWVYGLFGGLISLFGAGVAARHMWLQNLPADQVPTCGPGLDFIVENFPLADAVKMVLGGSGECAEQVWSLLGLGIPGWALVWFGLLGIAVILPLIAPLQRRLAAGD